MGCCVVMAMLIAEVLLFRDRLRAVKAWRWSDLGRWLRRPRLPGQRSGWPLIVFGVTVALAVLAVERDAPLFRAVWAGVGVERALSLCRADALSTLLDRL